MTLDIYADLFEAREKAEESRNRLAASGYKGLVRPGVSKSVSKTGFSPPSVGVWEPGFRFMSGEGGIRTHEAV